MPSTTRPAIILVHGAWHVPEHYHTLIHQLQQAGFEVHCPHLPTCNPRKLFVANMFDDATLVRNQIIPLLDKSHKIIMLLHSYGGVVGIEAVKGLSISERASQGLVGGVKRLVYMCGFMLKVGESVGGASLPRPDLIQWNSTMPLRPLFRAYLVFSFSMPT